MHVHTSGLDGLTESKAFAKFSKVFEEINHFFFSKYFFNMQLVINYSSWKEPPFTSGNLFL